MKFYAETEEDLKAIGKQLLEYVSPNKVLAFKGDMGVGKTTFISYLAQTMGVQEQVSSPTYGYVNEYESPEYGLIYHFDLYRIEDEEEAYDIGIEEYIYDDNWVFLEWAEKIDNLLPDNCVWIHITKDEKEGRNIEVTL